MCDVDPVIHRDRINGIIVDEDLMRNWAKDGWDTEKRGKMPTSTTRSLTHKYAASHTNTQPDVLYLSAMHLTSLTNLPFLFLSLLQCLLRPSCFHSFLAASSFAQGSLCVLSSTSLSSPLSLSLAQCPARSLESNSKTKRL